MIDGYGRAPASTVGSVVLTDLASGRSWEGVDVSTVSEAAPGGQRRRAPGCCCLLVRCLRQRAPLPTPLLPQQC